MWRLKMQAVGRTYHGCHALAICKDVQKDQDTEQDTWEAHKGGHKKPSLSLTHLTR